MLSTLLRAYVALYPFDPCFWEGGYSIGLWLLTLPLYTEAFIQKEDEEEVAAIPSTTYWW